MPENGKTAESLQERAFHRRAVNLRSVALGTLLAVITAAVAPFNDYVVGNTMMIGGYLPPVVGLSLLILTLLINAPLHRLRPSAVLSPGELAVVTAMLLVACSIPTTGLMRLFLPLLVAPFYFAETNVRFREAFDKMELPDWLFAPGGQYADADPRITTAFYGRVMPGEAIPYEAWIIPLLGWGVFFFGLFLSMLCLAVIIRRQWSENEHLEFPLAKLQLSLIEPPARGQAFNPLLRSKGFWAALVTVFAIHGINSLELYFPGSFPAIPLGYDLTRVMADPPFSYVGRHVTWAKLYFAIIGVSYFIPLRASFSIWAILLIEELVNVARQSAGGTRISNAQWTDQMLGASVAFALGLIWIARHDWARVIRNAFSPNQAEVRRRYHRHYCSDRTAVFGLLGGVIVMLGWLLFVGVQPWVAMAIVAFTMLAQFVTARFVAELGLPALKSGIDITQVTSQLTPGTLSMRDTFFIGSFTMIGPVATREALLPFAAQALQIDAQAQSDDRDDADRRNRRWLLPALGWALLVSFVVSAGSTLWSQYTYAQPLSELAGTQVNPTGMEQMPSYYVVEQVMSSAEKRSIPAAHSTGWAVATGATVTVGLQLASWRWSGWPLLPVGYLVAQTFQIHLVWASLFIGWLAKSLIVRFGGHSLFKSVRPVFVGLIFGEILAAAFWLLVALVLASAGIPYFPNHLMPS